MLPVYLKYFTVFVGVLPLLAGLLLLSNNKDKDSVMITVFMAIAFLTGIAGLYMCVHKINNHLLYGIFTVIEFTFFAWLLLGYSNISRWFTLLPLIIGIFLYDNDLWLSRVELSSLFILAGYAGRRISGKSVHPYFDRFDYSITTTIMFYSLNFIFYDYYGAGAEFYSITNIIVNIGFTKALGVKWKHGNYSYSLA